VIETDRCTLKCPTFHGTENLKAHGKMEAENFNGARLISNSLFDLHIEKMLKGMG
jgi:hypothetical protein